MMTISRVVNTHNAIYLELRYLISLICVSGCLRLRLTNDCCVSMRLPYSNPPGSRVIQHCAAGYHRHTAQDIRNAAAVLQSEEARLLKVQGSKMRSAGLRTAAGPRLRTCV